MKGRTMRTRPSGLIAVTAMAVLIPAATLAASPDPGDPSPSTDGSPASVAGHAPVEGTRWHLRSYQAEDGGLSGPTYDAWLTLSDGALTGSTGCNDLAGSYTLEGDALTLTGVSPTEATCLDGDIVAQEMSIVAQLPEVASVAFDGPDLWFVDATGNRQLRFHALEGPIWTPVYNGAEPMPAGVVSIEFRDSGVTGQGPCNAFSGPFVHEGASLVIGPLASTKMACPDLQLEAELLTDLQLARSYGFDSGDLVLLDESGAPIRSFAQTAIGD
jgi:heat shock protein HslJ